MRTFFIESMGVTCRMNFVNFNDDLADRFPSVISSDRNTDMEIFFLRGETGTMSPDLLKQLKRPFWEVFDAGERKTFCVYEGDVSMEFLTAYELNRSFLEFQNNIDIVFMHCASVVIDEEAYLFVAPSGGGKSTISESLSRYEDVEVIDDESSVLRCIDGAYYVQRHPVGLKNGTSSSRYRIRCVYFLEKAESNFVRDLSSLEAIRHILPEACGLYPTGAGKEYIALCRKRTFDFLSRMYSEVEVKLMGFKKGSEIRECLKIS